MYCEEEEGDALLERFDVSYDDGRTNDRWEIERARTINMGVRKEDSISAVQACMLSVNSKSKSEHSEQIETYGNHEEGIISIGIALAIVATS